MTLLLYHNVNVFYICLVDGISLLLIIDLTREKGIECNNILVSSSFIIFLPL